MKLRRKGVNIDGLSPAVAKQIENVEELQKRTSGNGVGCRKILEPMPEYIVGDCEKVIVGENNAFITLGRDRPGSRISGYGGKGHTQCGMVDITVGRQSSEPRTVGENEEALYAEFKASQAFQELEASMEQTK